jgi:hypothetical protein
LAQALPTREDLAAKEHVMTRDEFTRKILTAKRAKGLTWKAILAEIGGGSAVYLAAALLSQSAGVLSACGPEARSPGRPEEPRWT